MTVNPAAPLDASFVGGVVEQEPDLDLAEIQRLCDSASPGPWISNGEHEDIPEQVRRAVMIRTLTDEAGWPRPAMARQTNDAAFVAAARSLVPALVAELTATRKALTEAKADALREAADELGAKQVMAGNVALTSAEWLRVRAAALAEPEEPHYEITVWADGSLGESAADALFDRVAEAAHSLDEQVTCSSKFFGAAALMEEQQA